MIATDICAVNFEARLALLTDGRTVPVTALYDGDGQTTDEFKDAITFVCGEGLSWFVGRIEDFSEHPTIN